MGEATSHGGFARARGTLIAADVGGTHARVALLDVAPRANDFAVLQYRKYACADYPSLAAILDAFRDDAGGDDIGRIAVAIAGVVIGDAVVNVNLPWDVSLSKLRDTLGVRDLAIVNDFEAVGHAIGHLDDAGATLLSGPATAPLGGPMLVVGPGTGLGAALCIPNMAKPVVLATEAAQATLAAETDLEFEILRVLRAEFTRVQSEHVLSGTGMSNLYRAIATIRGVSTAGRKPAEITAAALDRSDVVAVETVETFCAWLGALLGDLALLYGAQGGIYLAGGVLPQMKELLVASRFVERFLDKGLMRPVLAETPVRLVEHAQLGVIGAASWYLANHPIDRNEMRERSSA